MSFDQENIPRFGDKNAYDVGTIFSLGDNVINDCAVPFTFNDPQSNDHITKPDWETPAQHKLSFIRCFSKIHRCSNYRKA